MLVDISRLDDLKIVTRTPDSLWLGALTTHAAIEDGNVPDIFNGLMRRVAGQISYRAVRNHGTIGGSVALADPAADWPACLLALGASLRVVGRNGVRVQSIDEFVQGAYETTLITGDIIMGFDIPAPPKALPLGLCQGGAQERRVRPFHRHRHAGRQGRPGQGRARRRGRAAARAHRDREPAANCPTAPRSSCARRSRPISSPFSAAWTPIKSGCTRRTSCAPCATCGPK